jgi:two-component system CheB/CheR fusion protein
MQSINEELQSTNEELETSKEELQSVNEELVTVNNELNAKVNDLSKLNNDMNNLFAGGGIATIFVDHQMKILRFTPATAAVIRLIPTDVGRPLTDIASKFSDYQNINIDVQSVLDTLVPKDIIVQTSQGQWYSLRIMPYRTTSNIIEGAVLSFVDITLAKQAEKKMIEANSLLRLATVVRDSRDAIIMQDLEGKILAWNPAAVKIYSYSESEALLLNIKELIPEDLRSTALEQIMHLSKSEVLAPYQSKRISKDKRILDVSITASAIFNELGNIYAISTTEREVLINTLPS